MSGLREPARTSMRPEHATSVRVVTTSLPSLIHRSTVDDPLIRTSNGSPDLTRLSKSTGRLFHATPPKRENGTADVKN